MNGSSWPEGSDRVAGELRAALDEAARRGPNDVALRRGWAAVAMPAPPARGRRWGWFAGGVVTTAVLAALSAAWLWPGAAVVAARWTARFHGAPVASSAQDTRRLTLAGGVEAQLGSSSVMRIEDGAPRVESGQVRFSVPHRAPGHPFVVHAEGYSVVVVGTKFGVDVDGRAVGVDVDEGVVEVWQTATHKRLARLSPGEMWRTADEAAQAPAPAPVPPVAPAVAPAADARAEPAQARRHPPRSSTLRLALASPREPRSAAARSRAGADVDDSTVAARTALASGDAPRALQIYREMALKTGPAAENAAYAVGKVLNDRLGQPAAAVTAWRSYRAEYPDGILRVEADVSIVETLARTGDTDEALLEANEFLRRHPESERRAEIARLAGDLYRARGDCRRAIGAYQVALGATRPRDIVEIASFHRASCLVRLGDPAGADAARAYLRAYPSGRFRDEAATLVNNGARSTEGRAARP